jgi:hypothetical protein
MTRLRGASNARVRQEFDWQPRYPSWGDGFAVDLGLDQAVKDVPRS